MSSPFGPRLSTRAARKGTARQLVKGVGCSAVIPTRRPLDTRPLTDWAKCMGCQLMIYF
jgi:hypothetical protein